MAKNPKVKEPSDMMKQYLITKEQYKDCVLFYRLGDFYELFNEDAVSMSRVLDLTLTGKDCGLDERAPMCGIPYHAAEGYINKLISLGYKIAICEQLTAPEKGKIVKRDVVRVITPGTVVDTGVLDEKRNNYIVSIFQRNNHIGVSLCELTTGEFSIANYDGEDCFNNLNDFLIRTMPSEIICNANYQLSDLLTCVKVNMMPKFSDYDEKKYAKVTCDEILSKYFGINYQTEFDIKDMPYGQIASGALLSYLEETQKRSLSHIKEIVKQKSSDYMQIDLNTRRNLEILETLKDRRKKGALISVIDKTQTTMGSRLMKNWIQEPLYNEKEINNRLNAVEELVKKLIARDELREILNKITDIERISGRIAYGNFTPRDAVSLRESLILLPKLTNVLQKFENDKIKNFCNKIPDFTKVTKLLFDAFIDQPPAILSSGGYISSGYNAELDEYKNASVNAQEWINQLEIREKEETGIKSLKISFNRVYGYFIEINKMFADQVPMRYVRKQTVANADRYITDELHELQEKIEHADENSVRLEQAIFKQIREILLENCLNIQTASKVIAELDCLLSFAEVAIKNNYVKPKVSSRVKHILIEEGRHPVVEDLNKNSSFIPNDTLLDCNENKVMIITGPNMAGKSTYMRQVAVITLLAHIGCFVPAKKAEIALTDKIFTRVGASDDLAIGQSTFMVEMMEVANILDNATANSLVVLDEIGRGTSTYDGLSIAWAVVEEIANNMHCKTLFATHYHELTELENFMLGVKNYRIAIKEINGQLVFLRKIQRGGANRSYGIEVAELAGVIKPVIERAKVISAELEKNDMSNHIVKSVSTTPHEVEKKEKSYTNIVGILKDIDINKVTPLGAFETLCDLVEKVKG
ncbi:MAG: DNA mismatch repair protein MutS [Clostridiales bacterium]|nr:DNA mismatch repair protein MutS [Clostridiales bacterium]